MDINEFHGCFSYLERHSFIFKYLFLFQVFSGNYDSNSIVRHLLTRVIFTYRIRIHPKTWESYASLRLEFSGCNFGKYGPPYIFSV